MKVVIATYYDLCRVGRLFDPYDLRRACGEENVAADDGKMVLEESQDDWQVCAIHDQLPNVQECQNGESL